MSVRMFACTWACMWKPEDDVVSLSPSFSHPVAEAVTSDHTFLPGDLNSGLHAAGQVLDC